MPRFRVALLLALVLVLACVLPSAASALSFKINNESGRSPEEVWVTVAGASGPGEFQVSGVENDVPKRLSEIPSGTLTIEKLISGRVYISYGAPVTEGEPFTSQTRFDWAELTVTPFSSDVANLTAVDQVGIGMRLDTYGAGEKHLEEVGAANSDTIFNALQQIPGGPQATVRNSSNEIVRILSPLHSSAYPTLGEYVRSLAGKTITLHTGLYFSPFATSEYSGTFAADGSITLTGTTNPLGQAPETISVEGQKLIENIYTGNETPNNGEGAIKRDLYAGFSVGLWDGKYGNNAINFCSNPNTTAQGSWCPEGFNQPAFGDARSSLSSFPTCEQYAAVINQYADEYGNPYSDASGKVTVGLDQPGTGGEVETLKLTILPDSGNAAPVSGGNPNCGAGSPSPSSGGGSGGKGNGGKRGGGGKSGGSAVQVRFLEKAKLHGRKLRVGRVSCPRACGTIRAVAHKGKRVVARAKLKAKLSKHAIPLRLTGAGRRLLAHAGRLKARVDVWVRPPGAKTTHARHAVLLLRRR